MIARLLAEPGRGFHVLDLNGVWHRAGGLAVAGDTGDVIDAKAREAYQLERAPSTVAKQIHGAIARIDGEHPSLSLHLTNSIRTGRYCRYAPERRLVWEL